MAADGLAPTCLCIHSVFKYSVCFWGSLSKRQFQIYSFELFLDSNAAMFVWGISIDNTSGPVQVMAWQQAVDWTNDDIILRRTVYPKKYAHGFCFAVLCCGYTLTDFPISIRLTSLALWQSNDCPSASKATLMNMDKYFMWIHYQRLHNHNKAKHNKTVCIFLGIYCIHTSPCRP